MNIGIVTCIYLNLINKKLGGSLRPKHLYVYSLLSFAKSGLPIICFTSGDDIDYLKSIVTAPNVEFRIFELISSPYHSQINTAKGNSSTTVDALRCYELVLHKIHFLESVFESSGYDSLIWIDANLLSRNLIPKQFFHIADARDGTPEHSDSTIFNHTFFKSLGEIAKSKIYFTYTCDPQHNTSHVCEVFKCNITKHLTAGVFAFNSSNLTTFARMYTDKVNILLSNRILFMEEVIYSCIYAEHSDMFYLDEFNGWHHRDNLIGRASEPTKPYYKILEKLSIGLDLRNNI